MEFHSYCSDESDHNAHVKRESDIYTFHCSRKIGRDIIKVGKLVCDAVYLNPLSNFKQWYTTYLKTKENPLSR